MVSMMLKFLAPEKRTLIEFMLLLYDKLDGSQQRDVAEHCQAVLVDGKIGLPEWSQFGKKLGAFRFGK
jgi:hypothetical protein